MRKRTHRLLWLSKKPYGEMRGVPHKKKILLQPFQEVVGIVKELRISQETTTAVITCTQQIEYELTYPNKTQEAKILRKLLRLKGKRVALMKIDSSDEPLVVRAVGNNIDARNVSPEFLQREIRNEEKTIRIFRSLYKLRMIRSALAGFIIQNLNFYRKIFMLIILISYLLLLIGLTAYFPKDTIISVVLPSYLPCLTFFSVARRRKPLNPFGREFWAEHLGNEGPRVAAYLRVSTTRQSKEGMSLEVQKETLDRMKDEFKPSKIYWFVDTISGQDFDKRKIRKILDLREKREIDELWVTNIDRIGRECRRSLIFFLQFSEDGGIVRTPDRIYSTEDLASLLLYVVESYSAQSENRRRAERANGSKIRNFKNKKWNKPIPLGYSRDGEWIRKINGLDHVIKDIFSVFCRNKSLSTVVKVINGKYLEILGKPLTRDRVRRILSDPVYVGRPTFLGTTVEDEQLRYIDDNLFNQCQSLLRANKMPINDEKRRSTLAQLAIIYDLSLLEFLEEVAELHHRECGGLLVRNGHRLCGLILQQSFRCSLCGAQFRVPSKFMLQKMHEKEKQYQPKVDQPVERKKAQITLDVYK